MSPLQKLVRIKELEIAIASAMRSEPSSAAIEQLQQQRKELLIDVEIPPVALLGNPDPNAWAVAMAEYFVMINQPTAYAWLSNAILAGFTTGQEQGRREGEQVGLSMAKEGFKEMADLLAFIRAGWAAGRIKSPMFADPDTVVGQTGGVLNLAQMIDRALIAAGQQ